MFLFPVVQLKIICSYFPAVSLHISEVNRYYHSQLGCSSNWASQDFLKILIMAVSRHHAKELSAFSLGQSLWFSRQEQDQVAGMFLHHLLRCSTHPGQPVWSQQVTQSSPPAICRDDRNFSRVIPAAGNHWTASVPQPWQRSLAQGLHSRVTQTWHPWLCATGTSLPGGPRIGPRHGASLNRGFVLHCSNLDQEWPAEGFREAALLGGGMWFRAELLALGGKTTAKGLETTLPQWKENGQGEAQGHLDRQELGTAIK